MHHDTWNTKFLKSRLNSKLVSPRYLNNHFRDLKNKHLNITGRIIPPLPLIHIQHDDTSISNLENERSESNSVILQTGYPLTLAKQLIPNY